MHVRYRIPLLLTALMLIAGSAFAQKPSVTLTPISETVDGIQIGVPLSSNVACQLGILGAPMFTFDYFLPPGDNYLTYLNVADCTACTGPGGVLVTTAHVLLNFQAAPCPMQVTVSIVGAMGAAGCREPDQSNVICAPTNYVLNPAAAGNYDFAMALPAACCITGDAFLQFTVNALACNTNATRPRLILQSACEPCKSYNIWPGGNDEFCGVIGAPNPIHYVDADCCEITGTTPSTWGRLKTLYR